MGRVEPDLEDTRIVVSRPAANSRPVDIDDTVAQGGVLPVLVEPPIPDRRPLSGVVQRPPAVVPEVAPLRARLSDGTVIDLDLTVYLGRKPSAPRIYVGPPPRLVTVPSPLSELSSTHLELRAIGGALVATDMRSTNGTIVHAPGSAPRTLIHGESVVVIPGTRIDLGEGVAIDILAPADTADATQERP